MPDSRLTLTERDIRWIKVAKKFGFLQPIKPDELRGNKTIICVCGDDRHIQDKISHHSTICGCAPHVIALNGGATCFAEKPHFIDALVYREAMLASVIGAIEMKGIDRIGLYAHIPCGVMHNVGYGTRETLDVVFQGKEWFKEEPHIRGMMSSGLKVYCHLHVCWNPATGGECPETKRETFFAHRVTWKEFWRQNNFLEEEEIFRKYGV